MKFFKLCSALTATVFYGVAVGMFGASFVNVVAKGAISGKVVKESFGNGFEIAFGQTELDSGNTLGTLFAFIFVVLGLLCALFTIGFALKGGKKRKGSVNGKLLCACCTFALVGILPAVLLFLTLQTTNLAGSLNLYIVSGETRLGVGAILSAVFSLLGAGSLGAALLK